MGQCIEREVGRRATKPRDIQFKKKLPMNIQIQYTVLVWSKEDPVHLYKSRSRKYRAFLRSRASTVYRIVYTPCLYVT